MKQEPAIIIWLPAGEVPQASSFEVASATTCKSLADALVSARRDSAGRLEDPWILTSDAIFGPDQIRVLLETLIEAEA
jgi:hypothetical protein